MKTAEQAVVHSVPITRKVTLRAALRIRRGEGSDEMCWKEIAVGLTGMTWSII